MPRKRNLRHFLISGRARAEPYRTPPRVVPPRHPPAPRNPVQHARSLKKSLRQASVASSERRDQIGISVTGAEPGLYVQFESQPGFDLKLESLQSESQGIEVVAVRQHPAPVPGGGTRQIQRATVFIPHGATKHFLSRFEQYATERTRTGVRRHKPLVESIATLRLATLRALWTDDEGAYPAASETIWWEVWLRRHDEGEVARLAEYAAATGMKLAEGLLAFDERIVVLVRGTREQLSGSVDVLNDLAEVRRGKSVAAFPGLPPLEQSRRVRQLRDRSQAPRLDAPSVCLLDTGTNRAHPLLEASLAPGDVHACDPNWRTDDHDGHGTEMAGLALYGDLAPVLDSNEPVVLQHRLESVKILPPSGANEPKNWGAITAQAVALPEIQAPARLRAFSMAVAAEDTRDRGRPTAWSTAVDALAAGRSFDSRNGDLAYLDGRSAPRLIAVCAGNVETTEADHLTRSDAEPVHDPGQAWNALTVGAYTDLVDLDPGDQSLLGYTPLGLAGGLSPYSSTSVGFQEQWPLKPEVLFEGGNKVIDSQRRSALQADSVSLLSTYYRPAIKPLVAAWGTSAATSQAARFAARIWAEYPDLWPEAVRALIVHSARWTPQMLASVPTTPLSQHRRTLVRRYGFGVPNYDMAVRSASNAVTLIAQDTLHPFEEGRMREMHLHALPWPTQALMELAEQPVQMRVTLSYFIEPNPGERGWKNRFRYASHGLRFEIKGATEEVDDFRRRLNALAREEDEGGPRRSPDPGWFLGSLTRKRGSIHSDVWSGWAADLASRGVVGIFPVSGWWKDQPKRDRSHLGVRYALVISIETPSEDVDIWAEIDAAVGVPVEVEG